MAAYSNCVVSMLGISHLEILLPSLPCQAWLSCMMFQPPSWICLLNYFHLFSLSENQSLLVMPPWTNYWLLGAMVMSIGLHFMILEIDFLAVCRFSNYLILISVAGTCLKYVLLLFQNVFQLTPLSFEEWIVVIEFSLPVIFIDELLKLIARKFTDGKIVASSYFIHGHMVTNSFVYILLPLVPMTVTDPYK